MTTIKKILLVGEFSNVHWTLAEGLRKLGHKVTVASKGDGWKNYQRDIDLRFAGKWDVARFFSNLIFSQSFKGYDYVQCINFRFLYPEERDIYNKWVYNFLRSQNRAIFLGAFGDDYFWAKACKENVFPYSNYDGLNAVSESNVYYSQMMRLDHTKAFKLNAHIAESANGIIAGLYDYYVPYATTPYAPKLSFIPLPVNTDAIPVITNALKPSEKLTFFLGIQQQRTLWKGTDKLKAWLEEYTTTHADETQLRIAVNVPYEQYVEMYNTAHIFVDQLYSQGFAMNALQAMAKSKIVLSGGEDAMYQLYGNSNNKPVRNIVPDKEAFFRVLDDIRQNTHRITEWGNQSRAFVEQYHHYEKVASQYLTTWERFA